MCGCVVGVHKEPAEYLGESTHVCRKDSKKTKKPWNQTKAKPSNPVVWCISLNNQCSTVLIPSLQCEFSLRSGSVLAIGSTWLLIDSVINPGKTFTECFLFDRHCVKLEAGQTRQACCYRISEKEERLIWVVEVKRWMRAQTLRMCMWRGMYGQRGATEAFLTREVGQTGAWALGCVTPGPGAEWGEESGPMERFMSVLRHLGRGGGGGMASVLEKLRAAHPAFSHCPPSHLLLAVFISPWLLPSFFLWRTRAGFLQPCQVAGYNVMFG